MTVRPIAAAAITLLLALAAGMPVTSSAGSALRPLSAFPRERIAVETPSARRHLFDAWRADTPETRAQGLMFVDRLRPSQAMIFVYSTPQIVSMWMKNTLIPLDMLFVDERGCVVKLHERAKPGALGTIAADVPVVLVVELAGGTAATLGLTAGDRVVRPDANWPGNPRPCTSAR
jgi:uncharacterized membrane protein (UPF0127 family)